MEQVDHNLKQEEKSEENDEYGKSESVPCRLDTYSFSHSLNDTVVIFYVIKLLDSTFVWVGTSPHKFTNLAMAMQTKYVSNENPSSQLVYH